MSRRESEFGDQDGHHSYDQGGRAGAHFEQNAAIGEIADDRLVLGPIRMNYHGFHSAARIALVREGPDRFRMVSEVLLTGGHSFAADDTVFNRIPAALK